jgi:hypothetical protein
MEVAMNTFRASVAILALIFSLSAFGLSFDKFSLSDGDTVALQGFNVSAHITDLPDFDTYMVLTSVYVFDSDLGSFSWNCDAAFQNWGHFDGINIEYLVPDVYHFNDEPTPSKLRVVAKVGDLSKVWDPEIRYPAVSGDEILVRMYIYGFDTSQNWHEAMKEVTLQVK